MMQVSLSLSAALRQLRCRRAAEEKGSRRACGPPDLPPESHLGGPAAFLSAGSRSGSQRPPHLPAGSSPGDLRPPHLPAGSPPGGPASSFQHEAAQETCGPPDLPAGSSPGDLRPPHLPV